VTTLDGALGTKNDKSGAGITNNSGFSRGDSILKQEKEEQVLSVSSSPSPRHAGHEQEPDLNSVKEGLSDIYDA
jgi:hypothetical protein